jgi:creatinine amidohydrolase
LADLTTDQVAHQAANPTILAIPVGSTEQHGPHLPLSTDTDIAVALAQALAHRRDDVLVAPALPYGSSGEHAGFAGTLSIGQEGTRIVLVELVRSATATFTRVLLIVGHGGNAQPVKDAVALLRSEHRDVLAWAPQLPGDAHAGRTETSLMLSVRPRSVDMEQAAVGATTPLNEILPQLVSSGVRAVSDNGVLGDPTRATRSHGQALLATAVTDLSRRVAEWAGPCRGAADG